MNAQAIMLATFALLTAHSAPAADDAAALKKIEAEDWTVPGIELEMKRIPAGAFTMGSPENESHRRADEVQHEVTISKPFYMGVYPVTQRQFYKLMMPKDYDYEAWQYKRGPLNDGAAFHFRPRPGGIIFGDNAYGGPLTDLHPMECVTWERADAFGRKVTEIEHKTGRLPEGYVYRLPTEAEWEYACRAGTPGPYNVAVASSDIKDLRKFAFFGGVNWWVTDTSKVGEDRLPNAWGLYDMHGNVYEWCLDWYGPYDTSKTPRVDPTGPAEGTEKVVRGGSFYLEDEELAPVFLRSASRYAVPPDVDFYSIVGMRLVLAPER